MIPVTTTSDLYGFFDTPAEAVSFYEGTGWRYLDYSFSDALRGNDPLMRENWRELFHQAKKRADELGIRFVQAHSPSYNPLNPASDKVRGREAMVRAIEACRILGIENMVTHMGFSHDYPYPAGEADCFRENCRFFRSLIPHLEEHEVTLCMENSCEINMKGRYFCTNAKELKAFLAELGHPRFAAAWDIGHAHLQGLDTAEEMVKLGEALRAIHIHDNNGKSDQHLPPYTGTVDFNQLRRGITESGFSGYFTFEADRFAEYQKDLPLALKKASLIYLYESGKAMLKEWKLSAKEDL